MRDRLLNKKALLGKNARVSIFTILLITAILVLFASANNLSNSSDITNISNLTYQEGTIVPNFTLENNLTDILNNLSGVIDLNFSLDNTTGTPNTFNESNSFNSNNTTQNNSIKNNSTFNNTIPNNDLFVNNTLPENNSSTNLTFPTNSTFPVNYTPPNLSIPPNLTTPSNISFPINLTPPTNSTTSPNVTLPNNLTLPRNLTGLLNKFKLKDSKNKNVNATIKIFGLVQANDLTSDLEIIPHFGPIKQILLMNVNITSPGSLGIETLPNTFPSPVGGWSQVFAIDPTNLNFDEGLVTYTATGPELYKCKDYNFTTQTCFGEWVLMKDNLVLGNDYSFILTAEDPIFANSVSTCAAENEGASHSYGSPCDVTDGSLIETDNSLVETQTYGKNTFGGLRIQSVDTTITTCSSITRVELCYERWTTNIGGLPATCVIEVDANGGTSFSTVTTTCPGQTANPGVTCSVVTSLETWVCGNFFGASGTRGLARMQNDRVQSGGQTTETLSTDVFFFNVTYTSTADTTFPLVSWVFPTNVSNYTKTSSNQTFNASVFEINPGSVLFSFDNSTGKAFNITATNQSGYWGALYNVSTLAEGTHTVTIIANDTAGNTNNTIIRTFITDYTNPGVTWVNPTNQTNFSKSSFTQPFNATIDELNYVPHVRFSFDNASGTSFNVTPTNNSGNWGIFYNVSSLAEGTHVVTIFANDSAGNQDNNQKITFTTDFTAPLVTWVNPVENSNFTSLSLNQSFNVTINELNYVKSVQFSFDNASGTPFNITAVNHSGNWGVIYNVSTLAEGTHTVTVFANDSVGNQNSTQQLIFITDFTSPKVTWLLPTNEQNFSKFAYNKTFNISINELNYVKFVQFSFDNASGTPFNITATNHSGNWGAIYNISSLAEGTHTVTVFANDSAGNQNITELITFNTDFTAPRVAFLLPENNEKYSTSTFNKTFNVSITEENYVNYVVLSFNNASGTPFNLTLFNTSGVWGREYNVSSLSEGSHTVIAFVNDSAGNQNNTVQLTFTVDNNPPNVTSAIPPGGSAFNIVELIEIGVNVSDSSFISQVFANLSFPNGSTILYELSNGTGHFSKYNLSFSVPILLGNYNITFIANDTTGNKNSTTNTTFSVSDNIAPLVTINQPPVSSNFLIGVNVTINVTVTDQINYSVVITNITAPNGSVFEKIMVDEFADGVFNFTFSNTGDFGIYNISIFANDTSNNINKTVSRTFNIQDEGVPFVTLLAPPNNAFNGTNTIIFLCNATDNGGLENITLYHNISGSFIPVETNKLNGTGNSTNFTVSSIADGTYAWNCLAEDSSSNRAFGIINFTINIDTTYPLVSFLNPTNVSNFTLSSSDQTFNASVLEINPSLVLFSFDNASGTPFNLTATNYSGNWGVRYNVSTLAEGTHIVTVLANDSAENLNDSVKITFITDYTSPTVTWQTPINQSNFSEISFVQPFNVTINELNYVRSVQFSFDNGTGTPFNVSATNNSGNWGIFYNVSSLAEGFHTITAMVNDSAGNQNISQQITFNTDYTIPTVQWNTPNDNSNFTISSSNQTFNATIQDLNIQTVLFSFDNSTGNSFNVTPNNQSGYWVASYNVSSLAEGIHTITIFANDSVGHINTTQKITLIIDNTPPNVTNVEPTTNPAIAFGQSLSVNASVLDTLTISTVFANVTYPNGTFQKFVLLDSDGNNVFNTSLITYSLGRHNITIFANDSLNNINFTETTFFNVTLIPNITLLLPAENVILSNSIVDFNFTVHDDEVSLVNCTLYGNFSGTFAPDKTITTVNNGSQSNITKQLGKGVYGWNVLCFDSHGFGNFSVSNRTVTVNISTEGLFVYQELNIQSPKYRLWSVANTSSPENNDSQGIGGDISWVVTKSNHQRKEFLIGTEDKQNDINLQTYNPQTETWGNLQEVSTDIINSGFRSFDLAYEEVSGNALIVYENSASSNSLIAYRTWNGTDYSSEQTYDTGLASAPFNWVKLTPNKNKNQMMLLVHNNLNDLYAVPWNGTNFVSSKGSTLSTDTVSNTEEHFSFAWEESSDEGLAIYGESSNLVYRIFNGTVWSGETTIALGENLNTVRTCSDANTDHIGVIWQDFGNDVQARVWDGNAFLASPPSEDSDTEPNGANNVNIDCAWLNSTTSIFGFVDLNALAFDYFTFTKANIWSTSDLTLTSTTDNFATDDISGLRFTVHPVWNSLMATAMDITNDISAISWGGINFKTISESPFEQDTEVSAGDQEGVMFDFLRFDQNPKVVSPTLNGSSINQNGQINISVNVTDDISVGNVIANVTLAGVSIQEVNLTDLDGDGIFNGTINSTADIGVYLVTIVAFDDSNHYNVNNSETVTFNVVDSAVPTLSWVNPSNNSNFTISSNNQSLNISLFEENPDSVLFSFDNASGTAFNVTATNFSGYWQVLYNLSTLAEGTHTITALANDTSGNLNNSESITIITDYTAPVVSWSTPTDGSLFTVSSFNQSFNATINELNYIKQVLFSFDNASGTPFNLTATNSSGTWTKEFNVSSLVDGIHTITIFANDSAGNQNNTEQLTILVDNNPPNVTNVLPTGGSVFNITNTFEISANVTEITYVSQVFANISYPNGSTILYVLSNGTGHFSKYNTSITLPALIGNYNFTIIANDSLNNYNSTQNSTFSVDDVFIPNVTINTPLVSSNFLQDAGVLINVTALDQINISVVLANVTAPNNSIFTLTLLDEDTDGTFNITFLDTNTAGIYNILIIANDTSNNINKTVSRTFNIQDSSNPFVTLLFPPNNVVNTTSTIVFLCNATDNGGLQNITLYHNISGLFIPVETINLNGTGNSTNFTVSSITDGTYAWNCLAEDTLSNRAFAITNFTISIDTTPPSVINIIPPTDTIFDSGDEIEFAANVTDIRTISSVFANVSYPNGSTILYTLDNSSDHPSKFNLSFHFPRATGSYNITFIANDSSNNYNRSEKTNFTVTDSTLPQITILGCTPSNVSLGGLTQCIATITDDLVLDTVSAIVTFPNGTNFTQDVSNIASNYLFNFSNTTLDIGVFNVTWRANDSFNNIRFANDIFNVSDFIPPTITLSAPANRTNTSSTSIDFDFTVNENFHPSLNCTLNINNTINQTNQNVLNNTLTTFTISNFLDGDYFWDITCNDNSSNFNTSAVRDFTVDTGKPLFVSISNTPNTEADLDPNVNINVKANITDNGTGVDVSTLQYKLSTDPTFTNITMGYLSSENLYNATFNATSSGTYYIRVHSKDFAGNQDISTQINLSVLLDRNWTRSPVTFSPVRANLNNNVSIGNLTVNNSGDYALNFTIVSNYNSTSYNQSTAFTLNPGETMNLFVYENATESGIKTVILNITVNDTLAVPQLLSTTGNIVVAPGQPILSTSFTTPSSDTLAVTAGDTNVQFIADIENIGEGNASNVSFFITLPTDWSITFGTDKLSFSTLNSGETQQNSIEISIPATTTAGDYNVFVNSTGINATGYNLTDANLTFGSFVKVTVDLASVAVSGGGGGESTSTTTSAESTSTGGGGGGGSGKITGAQTVKFKEEIVKVIRAKHQIVPVTITNSYNNSVLTNVEMSLEGFISQYVDFSPSTLFGIGSLQSKEFLMDIFIPEFFTDDEYLLTAKIEGDLIANNPELAGFYNKRISEVINFKIKVETVSKEDFNSRLILARDFIDEMKEAGFPVDGVEDLFRQAQSMADLGELTTANEYLSFIDQAHRDSFLANKLMDELKEDIKKAQRKWLKVPLTEEAFDLALLAFSRGDFSIALERIREAQLTFIFETKGRINIIKFFIDWWWAIILFSTLGLITIFVLYRRLLVSIIKHRIDNLDNEENLILDLIAEAQLDYFVKKNISGGQYKSRIENYEERLEKIRNLRARLRSKRVSILKTSQEIKNIRNEKIQLKKSLKKAQLKYFIHGHLSSRKFGALNESFRERLKQLEQEKTLLDQKLYQEKQTRKYPFVKFLNKLQVLIDKIFRPFNKVLPSKMSSQGKKFLLFLFGWIITLVLTLLVVFSFFDGSNFVGFKEGFSSSLDLLSNLRWKISSLFSDFGNLINRFPSSIPIISSIMLIVLVVILILYKKKRSSLPWYKFKKQRNNPLKEKRSLLKLHLLKKSIKSKGRIKVIAKSKNKSKNKSKHKKGRKK